MANEVQDGRGVLHRYKFTVSGAAGTSARPRRSHGSGRCEDMAVKQDRPAEEVQELPALPAGMLLAGCAALVSGLLPVPAFQGLAAAPCRLAFVVAMSLVTELVDEAGLSASSPSGWPRWAAGRVPLWLLVIAWPPFPRCSCPWTRRRCW